MAAEQVFNETTSVGEATGDTYTSLLAMGALVVLGRKRGNLREAARIARRAAIWVRRGTRGPCKPPTSST